MELHEKNKQRLKRDLLICKANLQHIDTLLEKESKNPYSFNFIKEHKEDREQILQSIKTLEEKIEVIENLGY